MGSHNSRPLIGLLAAGAITAAGLAAAGPAGAAVGTPAVANDTLTVASDNGGDVIALKLKAGDANTLVVDVGDNGGADPEVDRATFSAIVVNGGGGKDEIRVDESNGVFTDTEATTLNGDAGQDLLIGGSNTETLNGGEDDDGVSGRGGNDTMRGDGGNDRLRGGAGSDPQSGGAGADEFLWIPGDGNDVIEGGADPDSLDFDGSNGDEIMTVNPGPTPGSIRFFRNLGNITQDTTNVERVRVQALGGVDSVTAAPNLAPSIAVELNGGDGVDTLTGGPGRDLIVGARDADTMVGGAGDDTLVWNPGDASDVVDGGPGNDVHDFNGAGAAEKINVRPRPEAGRVQLLRDVAAIDQNIVNTEKIDVDALGANDELTAASGLAARTQVDYDAGEGNDTVTTSDDADAIAGGPGNDVLRAGAGDDSVNGGDGNDQLFGDAGLDRLTGGTGSDAFDCAAPGDVLVDAGAGDTVAANCIPPTPPSQPGEPEQPALPDGFRGFARPSVRAGGVSTLTIRLRNTHTEAIRLRVQASESGVRYRGVIKRIAAGRSGTVKLRANRKLRAKLARSLARRGRITRRPRIVVTNVETGGKRTVKPRLVVRKRR